MSTLKQYAEENNLNTPVSSKNDNQETINIPITVTGYIDNEFFEGIRLDTKEKVKIKMRPVEQKGENLRPVVENFADKKHKRYAEVNKSILLMENCYQEEDGTWNTRWANTLSSPKYKATVCILYSNVKIVEKTNRTYVEVNTLKSKKIISSVEDFKNVLLEAFSPKVNKARNFALIRLTDADGYKVIFNAYPNLVEIEEDGEKFKVMDSPELSYKKFMEDPKNAKKIKTIMDLINVPDITIEVFLGTTLYLGADTNKKIVDNQFQSEQFKKEYIVKKEEKEQTPDGEVIKVVERAGFKKTIIAFKNRDDGSLFVTALKALVNNEPPVLLDDLSI